MNESEIRQRIWQELQRATHDRHHEWRTPVLATVGAGGFPQARTVVLRQVDETQARLYIYTDKRSPKVEEVMAQPAATLVFWSKRLSWQLRVRADMSVQTSGPQVEAAWARVSQSAAAGDYLSAVAPGEALPGDALPAASPGSSEIAGAHHLAVLTAQAQEMDWLELAHSGHRRALMRADGWDWLVP